MRSGSAMEQVSLRTLHVEAAVSKKTYRKGDTATFPVQVTRPGTEDPFGQGIPMDRPYVMPAEDVNIGVGLLFGDVFLPGFAVTDAEGKAKIKVKIEKYVQPGKVMASFYTWKTQAESPCLTLQENGFRTYPDMFAVTK